MSKAKEIYDKAVKNDWSEKELEKALKKANIDPGKIAECTELSLDEMANIIIFFCHISDRIQNLY